MGPIMSMMSSSTSTNSAVANPTNLENLDAMELALSIPLIVQRIINHLEASSAKSARLVCSQWNFAVLSATKPLLTLHIYMDQFGHARDLFSPRLFRNISVYLHPDTTALENYNTIFDVYGDFVENFDCCGIGMRNVVDVIIPALDKFPNLEVLRIDHFVGKSDNENYYRRPFIITTKLKLVSLSFLETSGAGRLDEVENNAILGELHAQLQSLLNAAPNLKRLELDGNFYPDLSACSKLQTLDWIGCPHYSWNGFAGEHIYYLNKLEILLNQVAPSLKSLKLDCESECLLSHHGQIPRLKIPSMPNLALFKTKSFLLVSPFRGRSHFPKLKVLGLCQNGDGRLSSEEAVSLEAKFWDSFPPKGNRSMDNITKFKTDCIRGPDNFQKLAQLFPNLQEFNFRLRRGEEGIRFQVLDAIREMLSGMKKVTTVKATLPSPKALYELVEIFGMRGEGDEDTNFLSPFTVSGVEGLKRLKVKILYQRGYEDSGGDPRGIFDGFNFLEEWEIYGGIGSFEKTWDNLQYKE